jgi:hypothetical protein
MPEQPFNGKGRSDGVRVGIYCNQNGILGGEQGIKLIKLGLAAFSFVGMELLNERALVHDLQI